MDGMPSVEGVSHRYVEARGLRFHVAEAGSGEDVVVLLHGWPQHWYEWRQVMPALARRRRVLAIDLRGFGWTDAPRRGYLKEEMAADVIAVLDALGLGRVNLVGHDWGGWIGFIVCLRAPQRIERFLALNITHPFQGLRRGLPSLWRFWYQWLNAAPLAGYLAHRSRLATRLALRRGVAEGYRWDGATLESFAANLAEPARARAAVQVYRTFTLREIMPVSLGRYRAERLEVPTRIVFGSEDPMIATSLLRGHERNADDLEVELVPGCGHFIVDERPALVIERAEALFA